MKIILEVVTQYLSIQNKYDGGRDYKWEDACAEVHKLEKMAYGLMRRCRTSEGRFLARLLYQEIKSERKRLSGLCDKNRN